MRDTMRGTIFAIALIGLIGCAAALPLITKVVAAVTEAALWIDSIESFADAAFERVPNGDLEAKVDLAIANARTAAAVLQHAGRGAEHLSKDEVDKAFADLRKAYGELLALVEPLGVRQSLPDSGRMGVSPGLLTVPAPEEIRLEPTAMRRERGEHSVPAFALWYRPAPPDTARYGFQPSSAPAIDKRPWRSLLICARGVRS